MGSALVISQPTCTFARQVVGSTGAVFLMLHAQQHSQAGESSMAKAEAILDMVPLPNDSNHSRHQCWSQSATVCWGEAYKDSKLICPELTSSASKHIFSAELHEISQTRHTLFLGLDTRLDAWILRRESRDRPCSLLVPGGFSSRTSRSSSHA